MIWLDTKEEVDFDWFLEVLRNNELQVVPKKWTEEEREEVRREIAAYRALHSKTPAAEAVPA